MSRIPSTALFFFIIAAFFAGVVLSQRLRAPTEAATPRPIPTLIPLPAANPSPGPNPVMLPTPTPVQVEIQASPTLPPNIPNSRMTVGLRIFDAETLAFVRADVWLVVEQNGETQQGVVAPNTALTQIDLPTATAADQVIIRVEALGYTPWLLEIDHRVDSPQAIELEVPLEPIP